VVDAGGAVDGAALDDDVLGAGSLLDELDGAELGVLELDAADDVAGSDVGLEVRIGVEGGWAPPSPPHPSAPTSSHASVARSPLRACHRGPTSSP
jgi:hypothetical protein